MPSSKADAISLDEYLKNHLKPGTLFAQLISLLLAKTFFKYNYNKKHIETLKYILSNRDFYFLESFFLESVPDFYANLNFLIKEIIEGYKVVLQQDASINPDIYLQHRFAFEYEKLTYVCTKLDIDPKTLVEIFDHLKVPGEKGRRASFMKYKSTELFVMGVQKLHHLFKA